MKHTGPGCVESAGLDSEHGKTAVVSGRSARAARVSGATLRIGRLALPGELVVPSDAAAVVLLVHGSESPRCSARNRWMADAFRRHRLATLQFGLTTKAEARIGTPVLDIDLLSARVQQVLDWVAVRAELTGLRIGLFAASTEAAAVLVVAAARPGAVAALVCRGGRPDLAAGQLPRVEAPTLLIVGAEDGELLEKNRSALRALRCGKRLEVLPGATHRFEEPGAFESAVELAAGWFDKHLTLGW